MANFVKNGHFFWVRNDLRSGLVCSFSKQSHLTMLTKRTNKTRSQVIPDPKKWPFFTKSAIKNSNSYFLTKILTCPNFLDVRASTDVKRGQKFQLEPDQNPIRTWVEPDKSRCIFLTLDFKRIIKNKEATLKIMSRFCKIIKNWNQTVLQFLFWIACHIHTVF